MERQIAEIEQANQQGASRKTWKIMNDISSELVPFPVGEVVKLNGKIIKSPQVLLDQCQKYFSNVLKVSPVTSTTEILPAEADLEIKKNYFDRAEIDKAIKGLNNYKAPGFDYNTSAEAIKYRGDELAVRLLKRECHQEPAETSQCLDKGFTRTSTKKGNLTKITNYRGISLMSIAAKLSNKLLLNKIRDKPRSYE